MPDYSPFVRAECLESRHFSRNITLKIIRFDELYTTADHYAHWYMKRRHSLFSAVAKYWLLWRISSIYIVLLQLTNLAKRHGRGHPRKSGPSRGQKARLRPEARARPRPLPSTACNASRSLIEVYRSLAKVYYLNILNLRAQRERNWNHKIWPSRIKSNTSPRRSNPLSLITWGLL